jgi:hypothetical protein
MECLKNMEDVDNFGMFVFNVFALGIVVLIVIFLLIQFAKWEFSYVTLRMLLIAVITLFTICKINKKD